MWESCGIAVLWCIHSIKKNSVYTVLSCRPMETDVYIYH